jgi:PAS domain S-box-containing protein
MLVSSDRVAIPPSSDQQTNEIFRQLVESVKDYAIFLLTPDGIVATWNQGAKRIKGYAADEIIGKHFPRFYPQQAIEATGQTVSCKLREKRGDLRTKDFG